MKMLKTFSVIALAIFATSVGFAGEEMMEMPKPTAEHELLDGAARHGVRVLASLVDVDHRRAGRSPCHLRHEEQRRQHDALFGSELEFLDPIARSPEGLTLLDLRERQALELADASNPTDPP